MTAIEDTRDHASWVRVTVDSIAFDVAYEGGKPVAARFVSSAGMPAPWWLVETLDPHSAHFRATVAAEQFLQQFRAWAG